VSELTVWLVTARKHCGSYGELYFGPWYVGFYSWYCKEEPPFP